MKKFTLLLLIASLIAGTTARAQTITYQKKNATLEELLKVIVRQTGYGHIFKGETLEKVKRVTINVNNATLVEVLDLFFRDQPLEYTIIGKVISISPKIPLPTEMMTLSGRIMNEKEEFVPGVTVTIKGNPKVVISNDDGEFLIPEISKTATLLFTSIAYEPFEIKLQGQTALQIKLRSKVKELGEVSVVASGYQNISKERSTGSYSKINNDLLNRRVSMNILERIDDVTPGMILNKNITDGTNQSSRSIRGRSTIFSNAEPLIVVDNFPYPGNPNNINPNDIESITILKDANAAAIWGAFSGNGVIVITTKKGKYSQAPRLSLNNNVTVVEKPDAFYLPTLGTDEYISMEEYLFAQGFYTAKENDPGLQPLSPVVELLIKERDGLISTAEKNAQLAFYRNQDTRREVDKHFFRKGVYQQYSIGTSGGGANNNYYLSAGFDKNEHNLVGDKSQRVTLTANNTYSWFKNRLELNTGIYYAETKSTLNNKNGFLVSYPYLQFINGANDTVAIPYLIRQSYIESLNNDKLLDWNYNPVKEIKEGDNDGKLADYRINLGLKYKIGKGFNVNLLYQFNKGDLDQEYYNSTATYFTRNMINRFSELDGGEVTRHVPLGGIADRYEEKYKAQNVRAQLNYGLSWIDKKEKTHGITALAGAEVRDITVENDYKRLYGYNKGGTAKPIDDMTYFPLFHTPFILEQIPNETIHKKTIDRYVSYYMTAAYTIQERYTASISARKDESNLFGVKTNQKGVPLFSVGAAWSISREKFYDWNWLPYLKFRLTHGYNGNVNKSVSAFTTASILYLNNYNALMGTITNPPNPYLRWEKVQITNFGIDFAFAKGIIEGSIEYYIKKGTDLIGNTPVDPSNGITQFTGNNAAMKGSGIDVTITTNNLQGAVKWNTVLILNHAKDKVTKYGAKQTSIAFYYNATQISPLEDKPLYSVYSLKWMGLDPTTGDPLGLLDGQISKNYTALRSSANFDDLVYNGPATPTFFGSVRNTISWRQFALSFNITFKAGHYFRRNSIEYTDLIEGRSKGHPDYDLRWRQPGDESKTYIPSISYSGDLSRDIFYKYSEVLVEKGDNIRLQDLRLSYDLTRLRIKKLPMQLLSFYAYANNLGLLWKATKYDIDPDYISTYPNSRSWSVGVKMEF